MNKYLSLLLIVPAFGVTAMADAGGIEISASSVHVTQWSISGLPAPVLAVAHSPVLLPGIVLYPTVSPSPLLMHGVILTPAPSLYLSPHVLPIACPSAQLAMLSLLGASHGSLLGGNAALIGMQLNQTSLP